MQTPGLVRALGSLAFVWLALGGAGCQPSTARAPAAPHSSPPVAAAPLANADGPEGYAPAHVPRQLGSAALFLPGVGAQQLVRFATINGQAVIDGDILLGPATTLPLRYGVPWPSTLDSKSAVAVASRSHLWPGGDIPYAIDASAGDKASAISWALGLFTQTSLRLRPRAAGDRDYVVFRRLGGGCWSYLGRQGGPQDIDVTTCGAGNIAHELMHAAGFYHEQSRGDRDEHVTIVWDEIAPEMRSNFDKRDARGQDIGPYDYGSIMHYGSTAGSRSGLPTIIPHAAGVRIGQREGLSPLDRAAIETLYGAASPPVAASPAPSPPQGAPAPAPVPSAPAPSAPAPSAPVPPAAVPPAPAGAPPTPAPAPAGAGNPSFTGTYSSVRGDVACNQGGLFVQCQYPGGSLFCAASGPELACTWSGGGQGRATFQRQPDGVLAGVWGHALSTTDGGRWDLVPGAGASASPAAPASSAPAPAAPAASAVASLAGNFASSRGAMTCAENGGSVACNFQEPDGVGGRLDCALSQSKLELSCAWITFFPRPATGRAAFKRAAVGERRLSGTWGHFLAESGGGSWDMHGR